MKRAFVAFLLYCGLTIALTYPLILQLGSVFPHDAGDPALNTWLLWWNAHTMPYTTAWWNAPFFYPVTGALAFSEHLLGLSLIATPVQWLGFAPTVAYNVVFLTTFPLCAIGAYLLGREATGREDAAFIAGLLYGFAPYRIAQMAHIQMLAAFGMPFALVGLHRFIRERRWPWLLLFAVGWFLQALCNGYFLVFFGFFVGLWLLWFVPPWREGKTFATIVATWFVASVPLIPLLWQYQVIHQRFRFAREFGTMVFFGADLMALLNAAPSLMLWGHLHVFRRPEGELFPGITIVVILLAGLLLMWKQPISIPRSTRWWWARAAMMLVAVVPALVAASIYIIGPWELKPHRQIVFSVANPMKPLTYVLVSGIVLTLTSDAATLLLWPHAFVLRYTITIGQTLELDLRVDNLSDQSFVFTEALHTYVTVGDVRQIRISGLSGTTYADKVRQSQRFTDHGDIVFTDETDRVYLNTTTPCTVHDSLLTRTIVVSKTGSNATVIWNPWIAKAKAMADFGDDEWPGMVCVETVNALDHAVTLAPGASHHMTANIGAEAIGHG